MSLSSSNPVYPVLLSLSLRMFCKCEAFGPFAEGAMSLGGEQIHFVPARPRTRHQAWLGGRRHGALHGLLARRKHATPEDQPRTLGIGLR